MRSKSTKRVLTLTHDSGLTLDERDFGYIVGWPIYQGELQLENGKTYRTPHFAEEGHAEKAINILVARYELEVIPSEEPPEVEPSALESACREYRKMTLRDWTRDRNDDDDDGGNDDDYGGGLSNTLEMYYIRDTNGDFAGCQLLMVSDPEGPEIWVDTNQCRITGYWGREQVIMEMDARVARDINQHLVDLIGG